MAEFEVESKSQALTNLYLSALVGPSKQLYTNQEDDPLRSQSQSLQDTKKYLAERHDELAREQVAAQTALGFRFDHGLGVAQNCDASVVYYERAARQVISYLERTFALDNVENQKLALMGPAPVEKTMSFNR